MAKRFGWVLAVAGMTTVYPAFADDLADAVAQARAAFTLGDQHLAANRYPEARDAFESVLKVVDVPVVAFKAGQANERLGKLLRAAELYAQAIELKQNQFWADKALQLKAQKDAKAALADLNPQIPTAKIELQGDLDAIAEVTLDDTPLPLEALANPQRLDPGKHVVRATTKDRRSLSVEVTLAAGDVKAIALDVAKATPADHVEATQPPAAPLPVAPAVSPPSGHVATSKPNSTKPTAQQWAGYASLGVGAAGLVLGTTAGLVAWSKYTDMKSQCGGSNCVGDIYDRLNPSYDHWQTVSTVGFIVAGVGAAAGATLLLVHPQEKVAPSARLTVGPGTVVVRGAF